MSISIKVLDINWVVGSKINCTNTDCPICRNNLETSIVILGQCGHGFHSKCLDTWFQQVNLGSKKCPLCNQVFKEKQYDDNFY